MPPEASQERELSQIEQPAFETACKALHYLKNKIPDLAISPETSWKLKLATFAPTQFVESWQKNVVNSSNKHTTAKNKTIFNYR